MNKKLLRYIDFEPFERYVTQNYKRVLYITEIDAVIDWYDKLEVWFTFINEYTLDKDSFILVFKKSKLYELQQEWKSKRVEHEQT